jgi:hypothetical protein
MNPGSFLASFLCEMDAAERPNGYPGHHTGRELPEHKPRKPLSVNGMPTAAHPWRETQDPGRAPVSR